MSVLERCSSERCIQYSGSQDDKNGPFLNAFDLITKISRKGIMEHGAWSIFHNATNARTVKVDHVVSGNFGSFTLSQKVHAFRCSFYNTVDMTVRFQVIANNNYQNFHLTNEIEFFIIYGERVTLTSGFGELHTRCASLVVCTLQYASVSSPFPFVSIDYKSGAKELKYSHAIVFLLHESPSMAFSFTALLILRAESWDHGASL